jgi:CspA family cold shock protein
MVEDMIKMLEARVQPSLRRGKHVDRDTARRIGTILRAVADDLEA